MEEPVNDHEIAEAHRDVVEPLWCQPLLDEIADDVPLADEGTQLVAEVRSGYAPLELRRRLDDDVRMIALDPKRAMLDAARERSEEEGLDQIFFVPERVDAISYADEVFDAAACISGLVSARQFAEGLSELDRVTSAGGAVAVGAPLNDSFRVFYDLLDEAFRALELDERAERIESMRESLLFPARMVAAADEAGLEVEEVDAVEWNVEFASGGEFLHSPLVRETFFPHWIGIVEPTRRQELLGHVHDAMDTYWRHDDIETTVRAGFMVARTEDDD